MMRKLLISISLLTVMLSLVSCGNKIDKESQSYKAGIKAIDIADDYIDNKISAYEARSKLNMMQESTEKEDTTFSVLVSSDIVILGNSIFLYDSDYSTTTKKDVIKNRNNLAKTLNEKKRK